ncbi:MAG: HAMP domain-containing histidine kinase, partial [Rhizobiales bacterium]|nr:HAMP domain-containing histidine kinase [Hyphomicrobiales bacterium]
MVVALTARDDYVQALPGERAEHAVRFGSLANQTGTDLMSLAELAYEASHRVAAADASEALSRYEQQMRQFMVVTTQNDHIASEMRQRVVSLIALTDRARERQHESNGDIVASLRAKDHSLRAARELVDKGHEFRAQVGAVALLELRRDTAPTFDTTANDDWQLTLGMTQLRRSASELEQLLKATNDAASAREMNDLIDTYEAVLTKRSAAAAPSTEERPRTRAREYLADWADRLLKVKGSELNALQEELTQLMTYSVQANETEQATQNIAIETLKLGQRTAETLTRRDPAGAAELLAAMVDALEQWRERLTTAVSGLRAQNEMIADMDATAIAMVNGARNLNDMFIGEATRIGGFVRKMLLLGATLGLLVGSLTALVVVRSIIRPLNGLQRDMRALAQDPAAGHVGQTERRDELGDMARAANFFVTELGAREHALREEKNRADEALTELRRTQADLIQSEKLASLGQIVAGVAHEINTPVGIALTTATTLGDEVKSFTQVAESGQVPRSRFLHFIERVKEGSDLLFTNLTRAAVLVQSFKQVAADQVSSERRSFAMDVWARELLTSLQPVLRRSGHEVALTCPQGLVVDTYPGALAQVLTNLVMNALTHAFAQGETGQLRLQIERAGADNVRIVFADDGRGIAQENLAKVFDPFFTTARNRGSTGLGLHIVFNLVTGPLEGRIDVASDIGAGTRFTITMPVR